MVSVLASMPNVSHTLKFIALSRYCCFSKLSDISHFNTWWING